MTDSIATRVAPSSDARRATWLGSAWVFAAVLFTVALVLRVATVRAFDAPPTWDGHFYHVGAVRIAEGHGYSEDALVGGELERLPWSHYPVGYSALLGAVYRVFGPDPAHAQLANALLGALMVVVGFGFARAVLDPRRARIAGALLALHPGLVLYTALLMTEPLAALLVLISAYLARVFGARRFAPLAVGITVAASGLVRPPALLLAPLLLLLFPGDLRRRLQQTLLSGVVAVLAIAPWTIRNCRVLDACALISTNGGWNLAISALSETGRYRPLTPEDGCAEVITPVAQDRCWADVGRARIAQDPLAWLARIPDKLRHTYNHESFAVAYLAESDPDYWQPKRKFLVMNAMTGFHHLLTLVAAFSAIGRWSPRSLFARAPDTPAARRERWSAWVQAGLSLALLAFAVYALTLPDRPLFWISVVLPLLGFARLPGAPPLTAAFAYCYALVAVTSLTHMVFFGDDRYHFAITPTLCFLAAAALRRPFTASPSSSDAVDAALGDPLAPAR